MINRNKDSLTFPQRYWLLLCVLVAIISIGATYYIQKKNSVSKDNDEIKTNTSSAIKGQDSTHIPPDSLRH